MKCTCTYYPYHPHHYKPVMTVGATMTLWDWYSQVHVIVYNIKLHVASLEYINYTLLYKCCSLKLPCKQLATIISTNVSEWCYSTRAIDCSNNSLLMISYHANKQQLIKCGLISNTPEPSVYVCSYDAKQRWRFIQYSLRIKGIISYNLFCL